MLIPVLSQGAAYYVLLPIFWPLFLAIYYVIPAYLAPYLMKHCMKVTAVDARSTILSGIWAFFFALPFVHAFADNFVFLFFITTRSLILYAFMSFLFQWLYLGNTSTMKTKQTLLSLCMTSMIGYWMVCLFYYAFSYVFVIMNRPF